MPEAELPDSAGKLHTLKSLYGRKLTVVCFWTIGDSTKSRLVTTRALKDLMKDVAEPFGEKGVRVIGIDVGDTADAARQQLADAGATFPNLVDPSGEFFGRVAKVARVDLKPRPFLLDANGRILWFDVELPRDSMRDMAQGIRAALGEP